MLKKLVKNNVCLVDKNKVELDCSAREYKVGDLVPESDWERVECRGGVLESEGSKKQKEESKGDDSSAGLSALNEVKEKVAVLEADLADDGKLNGSVKKAKSKKKKKSKK